MNKPFVRDNAIFIPTYGNAFLSPEYRDETVLVAGEDLTARWGWYYGGNYRHRPTDNPEADLAAVLAVYERNTAPKGPYVDGPYLHIPAGSDTLLLSEYVDADVWVAEDTLNPDWGYLDSCRKFRFSTTTNPEADLAKVMEIYERNTNKDVVITITKLPPEPHPESGTEIPVPMCRVAMHVDIPDIEIWRMVARLVSLQKVTVFESEKMSEAVAKAEAEAAVIRTAASRCKERIVAYNEKRAAAIAAADAEYERRANS